MVFVKRKNFYAKIEKERKRAIRLYAKGLTMREVGEIMNRSRQWVSNALKSVDN